MEKTLQQQYNLIKEGKGSKDDFLKSARRVFPEYITPLTDYKTAVHILKGKSVLSEGVGGIITQNPIQPDWFKIFDTNLNSLNEEIKVGDTIKHKLTGAEFKITKISGNDIEGKYTKVGDLEGKVKIGDLNKTNKNLIGKTYELISEAVGVKDKEEYGDQNTFKASKETEETLKKANYDNKDPKNIDNVYGQSFLMGYYTEMKDPKNSEKTVDELKAIVLKNMDKDINYYHTEASFGVKGIGYKKDVVGGGEPKAPKGKYKSSGYGDLKK